MVNTEWIEAGPKLDEWIAVHVMKWKPDKRGEIVYWQQQEAYGNWCDTDWLAGMDLASPSKSTVRKGVRWWMPSQVPELTRFDVNLSHSIDAQIAYNIATDHFMTCHEDVFVRWMRRPDPNLPYEAYTLHLESVSPSFNDFVGGTTSQHAVCLAMRKHISRRE